MSKMPEYESFDAVALAQLVHAKQLSPAELLEAAIERIERDNGARNAVVEKLYDSARDRARQPLDGPFAGVPFLIKDLAVQVAGAHITSGSRLWQNQVGSKDSTIVARYRAAGLILAGITNSAELGLSCETAPSLFGATRNPWDATRSAGGSSGGSAAAVAAGMVPAAHANDGGGSIRIPSSCCGVFGLKTSRGRNPVGPDVGEGWNGLAVHHAITRSVRDSAALLDATHGPEPGDPYAAPHFGGSFVAGLREPQRPLRIALQTVTHAGEAIDPKVAGAARDAANLLASLGHHVEEARPKFDAHALKYEMFTIVGCNIVNALRMTSRAIGRPVAPDDVERITWLWMQRCEPLAGHELARAIGTVQMIGRQLGQFFERHDVLLTPTMPTPPTPLQSIDMRSDDLDGYYDKLYGNNTFTTLYNCTGLPAASVPLAWVDGLPVGIQIAAPLGHDMRILRLAAQLEEARPWADRRPPRGK
jgi:amidase